MRPTLEVADIFRSAGPAYLARYGDRMPLRHKRAIRAIQICRTAELGGHVDRCQSCGHERISYNSCRNRHCPKCQFLTTERWIDARRDDLLPVSYFHVVFTLPEELRALAIGNQRVVYDLLFKAASETLLELSRDPGHLGAKIGVTAVLHTWSQTLVHHPHVHCIVTGGGLTPEGTWKASRRDFFLPVKVMSRLYRGKFMAKLKDAEQAELIHGSLDPVLRRQVYAKEWNVYCKRTFQTPEHVVTYLGRYTHRIAISNHRLVDYDGENVRFRYRDSADHDRQKTMTLDVMEFLRRFLQHVLPDAFVKIRHYGLLANRSRRTKIDRCRRLLLKIWSVAVEKAKTSWQELLLHVAGVDVRVCPSCGGSMIQTQTLARLRAPPRE